MPRLSLTPRRADRPRRGLWAVLAASIVCGASSDLLAQSYHLPSSSPDSQYIRISNPTSDVARFALKLNGLGYRDLAEVVADIQSSPDEYPGEPDYRKVWRFVYSRVHQAVPFTAGLWYHTPTLLLNSTAFGFCDDVAHITAYMWQRLGYTARVWALEGHVVPELLVGDKWSMFDPALRVYYLDDAGAVAGVEELAADPNLITNPRLYLAVADPVAYGPSVADIYATQYDNSVIGYWGDGDPYELQFVVPPGGSLDLPRVFESAVDWLGDPVSPGLFTEARLTIPPGWQGTVDIPLVVNSVQGSGQIFFSGAYWDLGSSAFQDFLASRASFFHEFQVLSLGSPLEVTYLLNPSVYYLQSDNDVVLSGTGVDGLEVRLSLDLAGVSVEPLPPVAAQTPVTFVATSTGGVAPLQYRFWLYDYGTSSWTVVQDYSPANQLTWTPAQGGRFALQIWVRNAGSTADYDAWLGYGPFEVTPAPAPAPVAVTTLTTATVFPVAAGTPVTFVATATGGVASLEYQFWLYQGGGTGWTVLQDWGPANEVTWTPLAAGTYALQAWVRSAGSMAAYDAWRGYGPFEVKPGPAPVTVTALTTATVFPVAPGTPVTFTATATGGTPPLEYEFWLYRAQGGGWTVLRGYGPEASVAWTPTEVGQYLVQVWVRSAGATALYEAWRNSEDAVVADARPRLTGVTPQPALPVPVSTPVTFVATATGGVAPLEYQFWLYQAGGAGWTVPQGYTTSNQVTWTPTEAGTYALQAWVRSAGSTATWEDWKGLGPFSVFAALTVTSFTPNVAPPVTVGTPVTLTAVTAGGVAPVAYQFWVYQPGTGWTVLQDYSPANQVVWTPTEAGTYALQVWVRSAGSTATWEAWKGLGSFTVVPQLPVVTALTPSVSPPLTVGVPMTWTATATGGVAPLQYQFWLYQAGGTGWTVLQDYSASNQVAWTPTEVGSYALQVWVRSAGSTATYEAWRGSGSFQVQ